jgi:putative flippase GtrA
MISQRFLKFLVAGGIAALVNFGSRILLGNWMAYVPSIIVAYLLGMGTAFVLNRLFVFAKPGNRLHHQVWWFTVVNLAGVLQTIAVSVALAKYLFPLLGGVRHGETLAHAIGVAVPTVTSYIGHKYLSFRPPRSTTH